MIYLDAAATSFLKPPCVAQAVVDAMHTVGSPGRGAHPRTLAASRTVWARGAAVGGAAGGGAGRRRPPASKVLLLIREKTVDGGRRRCPYRPSPCPAALRPVWIMPQTNTTRRALPLHAGGRGKGGISF